MRGRISQLSELEGIPKSHHTFNFTGCCASRKVTSNSLKYFFFFIDTKNPVTIQQSQGKLNTYIEMW